MTFYCRHCQKPHTQRLFFASFLLKRTETYTGFLCAPCHDRLQEEGRIIGYVSSHGDGAQWIAKLFALRTLHDQHPNPHFAYDAIQKIQGGILRIPLRKPQDLIDRVADAYCWLATVHSGLRTFEGWLFGTAGRNLKLMLGGENEFIRGKSHRQRQRNILALHDRIMEAARAGRRTQLIRSLAGIVAASTSSRFTLSAIDSPPNDEAVHSFLTGLIEQPPVVLGAYQSWEAIATGNFWVVFLATRIGCARPVTIRRAADMLLRALDERRPHRYEVMLRALHWDVLLDRCLELTSLKP